MSVQMAFVAPLHALPARYQHRFQLDSRRRHSPVPRRAQWVSMAKSHPYGDGGVPQEPDWTGFDMEEFKKECAEAERIFNQPGQRGEEYTTPWAIVMSADIIQWNNNLFKESRANGFEWNLEGLNVVHMAERTARRALPSDLARLWVISLQSDGLLTFARDTQEGKQEEFLLAFEASDEAVRFADHLTADDTKCAPTDMPIVTLKSICAEGRLILGVVPQETLVSPLQFK